MVVSRLVDHLKPMSVHQHISRLIFYTVHQKALLIMGVCLLRHIEPKGLILANQPQVPEWMNYTTSESKQIKCNHWHARAVTQRDQGQQHHVLKKRTTCDPASLVSQHLLWYECKTFCCCARKASQNTLMFIKQTRASHAVKLLHNLFTFTTDASTRSERGMKCIRKCVNYSGGVLNHVLKSWNRTACSRMSEFAQERQTLNVIVFAEGGFQKTWVQIDMSIEAFMETF